MKIIVRLYRQHDLDLLVLKQGIASSFQKVVREAIRNYVREQPYLIDVSNQLSLSNTPKSSQFHITLFDDKDSDVIQWLSGVSKGYRNSLIKNIVRSYLSRPVVDGYLTNGTPLIAQKTEKKSEKEILTKIMSVDITEKTKEDVELKRFSEVVTPIQPESQPTVSGDFDLLDEFESMMNF